MDNVLNGNDPATNNYFSNLLPQAVKASHKNIVALGHHQITSLHLIRLGDLHAVSPLGIIINSQLTSVNLKPNQETNVVNSTGHVSDANDNNSQEQEQNLYVLNQDEASKVIASGAYDHPKDWDRALNTYCHGFMYDKACHVNVYSVLLNGKKDIYLTYARPEKQNQMKIYLVTTNDSGMEIFDKDSVDNDFGYILSETTADIADNLKQHDNGYRPNHAIIRTYQNHNQHTTNVLHQMIDSLANHPTALQTEATPEQVTKSSASVVGDVETRTHKTTVTPKNKATATSHKDKDISNKDKNFSNEIDLNPKDVKEHDKAEAKKADKDKQHKNGVTGNSVSFGNEINLGGSDQTPDI